ncbi:MAG: PAS domain S-box protein, partial [Chitinophagaceae bacterium]
KGPDVEGKSLFTVLPELNDQVFPALLKDVYTTGEPFIGNEILLKLMRQGVLEDTYFNFVYQPYREVNETITGVTLIAYEVTDQVLAKKKTQKSENYFRQLTDTVPAIIWITDAEGNCNYLNKHWYDYTGQTREEAEGFGWLNATHPDDKAEAERLFIEANTNHTIFSTLYRLRQRSGEYRWAIDSGSPKFGPDGRFEGMIGTVVDVHDEKTANEALSYRKALLEAHNEASADGIILIGKEGKIVSYNQRFVEIWAIPQTILDSTNDGEALAFAMTRLVDPEKFIEKVNYLYNHPSETSIDELLFKDGKIIERHGYPVTGEDGTYYAWSWTFKDVTAQKTYEKTIRESEERFRSLADQSPIIVYIVEPDAEATISYFNKTWLDYTGQSFDQAIGRAWDGIVHPDDVQGVLDIYMPALQQRTSYIIPQVRLKRNDGEYRWHMVKGNPRYLRDSHFMGFVGVGFDIHETKLAEDALKESTERFSTLANNIQNLAWMAQGDGCIFWYNKRWYEYTDTTLEEMQGWGWKKVHHPQHIDRVVSFVSAAWEKGEPYELTFPLLGKDGRYRWFLTRVFPVHNTAGEVVRWIGTNTDIEDQIMFSERLEKLIAERTKELQRSNEDLQQFAHVASHDLKEPVRKIKTFSSRVNEEFRDSLPEKAKIYIDKMVTAADRMYAMIDGVLLYSSLNALEQSVDNVDLNHTLKQIEDDLEVLILEKNAAVQYGHLPVIRGSDILIYQLFYNLINNSLKFASSDRSPVIDITAEMITVDGTKSTQIVVQDNGIGFDVSFVDKIFKTFTRLNSKDKYEGTGLGLSLCKKIVERHGGTIAASGEDQQGARFTIVLPAEQSTGNTQV